MVIATSITAVALVAHPHSPSTTFNAAPAARQAFLHYLPRSGFPLATMVADYRATGPKKQTLYWLMKRQEGYTPDPEAFAPPPVGLLTPLWRIEAVALPRDFTAHVNERYFIYVSNGLHTQSWLFQGHRTDTPDLIVVGHAKNFLGSVEYDLWYPRYDYFVDSGYFVKLRGRAYRAGQLLLR